MAKNIKNGKKDREEDEALLNLKNKIAFTKMEEMSKEDSFYMTTEEIIETKNFGRK